MEQLHWELGQQVHHIKQIKFVRSNETLAVACFFLSGEPGRPPVPHCRAALHEQLQPMVACELSQFPILH